MICQKIRLIYRLVLYFVKLTSTSVCADTLSVDTDSSFTLPPLPLNVSCQELCPYLEGEEGTSPSAASAAGFGRCLGPQSIHNTQHSQYSQSIHTSFSYRSSAVRTRSGT